MAHEGSNRWHRLEDASTQAFQEARLQAHWALQVPAAFGRAWVPAQVDGSHQAFWWDRENARLVTGLAPGPVAVRVGFSISDLGLVLLDAEGVVRSRFSLQAHTLSDGLEALSSALSALWGGKRPRLAFCGFEPREHPVGAGHPFCVVSYRALDALSHWFANAELVLAHVGARAKEGSPVCAWPDRFELETSVTLPGDDGPASVQAPGPGRIGPPHVARARAPGETSGDSGERFLQPSTPLRVRLGLSLGDRFYREPYWYVRPRAWASSRGVPEIPRGGHWHREGWQGAVLPASSVVGADSSRTQRTMVEAFVATVLQDLGRCASGR